MMNPIGKGNLRRPVKLLLLSIVLLVGSSLFISSITQYLVLKREITHIGEYYSSVGLITPKDASEYHVNTARNVIAKDPMIRYEDIRRYCFGTIEGLYNPDIRRRENLFDDPQEDYQEFLGDLFFTAKITGVSKSSRVESIEEGLDLGIVIEELLAGFPDNLAKPGGKTELLALSKSLLSGKEIPYINPTVMEDLQSLEK